MDNIILSRLKAIQRDLDAVIALMSDGTSVLDVPYLSQWGATANERRGDCGPACVAMLAHYLTAYRPSVNQAADACGQPTAGTGQFSTTHAQLRRGGSMYGILLDSYGPQSPPPMTHPQLQHRINAGKPSIVLLDYGVLRDRTNPIPNIIKNQDQRYVRGHWCVFVGYDENGVYINDPNYWGARESDGDHRFVPLSPFLAALDSAAPGNKWGQQGLEVR